LVAAVAGPLLVAAPEVRVSLSKQSIQTRAVATPAPVESPEQNDAPDHDTDATAELRFAPRQVQPGAGARRLPPPRAPMCAHIAVAARFHPAAAHRAGKPLRLARRSLRC
jgi:hypothetical protein